MGDRRYRAFISYSHADEEWGAWLQRALERFRAPGALAATLAAQGISPRLGPVFRDREDLPVAGSLNEAIKAALADSEYQIVVCSPNSAKSRWVNEEIRLFHKLHGPNRVFALIIGGEPGASSMAGRENEECFPPALRFRLNEEGEATADRAEPLAADAREDKDGKRYALLKVAAGMLGVGLDDLVRRDAARNTRIAVSIAVGSIAGAAVAVTLAVTAFMASREATMMRGKAENLIEFMLTDLRDRLEKVGRLDILESVGGEAMAYYEDQDLKSLDDDALARRAKTTILLGSIDFRRNDIASAQKAYEAAEQATGELLNRSPNDPDRIFEHAQAVFYVGETMRSQRNLPAAEQRMGEYLRLAEALVAIDADDPQWRLELAYATSNMGIMKFDAGDYDASIAYFKTSIEARKELFKRAPDDPKLAFAYAYSISWRAYAELMRGRYGEAINLFDRQLAVYGASAEPGAKDYSILDAAVVAQRRLAEAHLALGEISKARAAADAGGKIAAQLLERDGDNANWCANASYIERMRSLFFMLDGNAPAAAAAADRALAVADSIAAGNSGDETFRNTVAAALAWRIRLEGEASIVESHASRLESLLQQMLKSAGHETLNVVAPATFALARYERSLGNEVGATALVDAALPRLEASAENLSTAAQIYLAGLFLDAGQNEKALPIVSGLERLNVSHPDFLMIKQGMQQLAEQ